jgi:hypothetical protein
MPLLRIARLEAERHTAHRLRAVGHIGLAAGQRKTADDGYAAGLEDDGLGKARALAVALEVTRDADALGVIAAEAGIDAVDLLERVDQPRLRQAVRREPASDIGKASRDGRNGRADHGHPDEGAPVCQRRQPVLC